MFNLGTIYSKYNNSELCLDYYQQCSKLIPNRQKVKCYELIANECLKTGMLD